MASLLVPCNAVTRLALVAACAGRWREAAGVAAREGPAWSGAVGVTEKCGQAPLEPRAQSRFGQMKVTKGQSQPEAAAAAFLLPYMLPGQPFPYRV